MLSMWFPLGIPMHILSWIHLVVATPAFVYVSAPIFRAAWLGLRNRTLNMDVMYAMGIGVAYVASVMGTLGIVLTHEFMFYETALMLAGFLTLGRYLEARAKGRTGQAIRALMNLAPRTATVVSGRDRGLGPGRGRRARRPRAGPAGRADPGRRHGHGRARATSTSR